jgi:hypothetical protein
MRKSWFFSLWRHTASSHGDQSRHGGLNDQVSSWITKMLFPVLGLARVALASGLSDVDSGNNNRRKCRIRYQNPSSDTVIIKLLLLPCYSNFPLSLKDSVKKYCSEADGRKSSKLIVRKSPGLNIQKIREMVFMWIVRQSHCVKK